jgi:hypothetical protein
VVERYHLGLLGWSVLTGLIGVAPDLRRGRPPPRWWSRRVVAVVGLAGAVLGSAAGGWQRATPWLVLAAGCTVLAAPAGARHPLGRWTVPAALVSLVGVWSAVPDTQAPLALAGVWAPLGALWALRGRPTGPVATAALLGGIVGAAWVGSAGWGAALASVVAVGMLLAAPLAVGGAAGVQGVRLAAIVSLMGRTAAVAAGLAALTLVVCVAAARAVGGRRACADALDGGIGHRDRYAAGQ